MNIYFSSLIDPERWTNIPLLVKILKLIINELSNAMEANASRQTTADWSQGKILGLLFLLHGLNLLCNLFKSIYSNKKLSIANSIPVITKAYIVIQRIRSVSVVYFYTWKLFWASLEDGIWPYANKITLSWCIWFAFLSSYFKHSCCCFLLISSSWVTHSKRIVKVAEVMKVFPFIHLHKQGYLPKNYSAL